MDPNSNERVARDFVRANEGAAVTANDGGAKRKLSRAATDQDIVDLGAVQGKEKDGSKILGIDTTVGEALIDGKLVGGDGKIYPATHSLRSIPGRVPDALRDPETGLPTVRLQPDQIVDIIQINGILTKVKGQFDAIGDIANALAPENLTADSKVPVIRGVHNGTDGAWSDLVQCVKDSQDIGNNTAVASLRDKILDRVTMGMPVNVLAHSQGGLVTRRALSEVRIALQEGLGLSRNQAIELMQKTVREHTNGAAAMQYPTGPDYIHVANSADPVPMFTGIGVDDSTSTNVLSLLGRARAKIAHLIRDYNPLLMHRHEQAWYWGDKSPNTATLEELPDEFKRPGLVNIANHDMSGPYAEYMGTQRERLMTEFFQPASFQLSDQELQRLGLKKTNEV